MATNEKSRVTVAITAEMNEKLREEAKKRGLSISAVVTLALEDYLKIVAGPKLVAFMQSEKYRRSIDDAFGGR